MEAYREILTGAAGARLYRRKVVVSKRGVCLLEVRISEELYIDNISLPSRIHEIWLLSVRGLNAQRQCEHGSKRKHDLDSGHVVSEHC